MSAPPPALVNAGNAADAGVNIGQHVAQPAGMDDADRRPERRLRFYAAVYMMLGASFLLRVAAVPARAPCAVQAQQSNGAMPAGSSAFEAAIGISLWAAAVALALLSFHRRRFPLAAARLARAALRAFF